MLGAIVGDIVGSVYEWNNIKTKDFPLFREACFFTDDTVMTCAVAEAIMNGGQKDDFIDTMRVSPCTWVMDCGFCARTGTWPSSSALARIFAEVTPSHPEGIKGVMATADAIFLCRYYFGGCCGDYERPINDKPAECKRRIKEHIEQ